MGPFDDCAAAFAPLANETIVVRGRRNDAPIEQTLKACILEGAFDDPVDGDSVASTRRTVDVLIPIAAWRFDTPPQVGDTVECVGGNHGTPSSSIAHPTFIVNQATPSLTFWRLACREGLP